MKALSVHPQWAALIRSGAKTLEIRSRRTSHRGPLLVCASQEPAYGNAPRGVAACIVNVVDCRYMEQHDEAVAGVPWREGAFAWVLADVTPVEPVPVSGQQGLFEVDWDALLARYRAARTRESPPR